ERLLDAPREGLGVPVASLDPHEVEVARRDRAAEPPRAGELDVRLLGEPRGDALGPRCALGRLAEEPDVAERIEEAHLATPERDERADRHGLVAAPRDQRELAGARLDAVERERRARIVEAPEAQV